VTGQADTPIYKVTVVQRTAKAVNYHYRLGPTKIDFRGTVLLPEAKGKRRWNPSGAGRRSRPSSKV
jgi:hypothetical protein